MTTSLIRATLLVAAVCSATCFAATSQISFYQVVSTDLTQSADVASCGTNCNTVFMCTQYLSDFGAANTTTIQGQYGGTGMFKGTVTADGLVQATFLSVDGSTGSVSFNLTGNDAWNPTFTYTDPGAQDNWAWGNWDASSAVVQATVLDYETAATKCMINYASPRLEASISEYPGVTNPIQGTASVTDDGFDGVNLHFNLSNLAPSSTGGIHIHTGLSCDNAAGHFWLPTSQPDPWTAVMWTSDTNGNAQASVTVAAGYNLLLAAGRTVVVHAPDGTRIGCGVLDSSATSPSFSEPPLNGVYLDSNGNGEAYCGTNTQQLDNGGVPVSSDGSYQYTYTEDCDGCCSSGHVVRAGSVESGTLKGYETIILGSPIWAGMWQATTGALSDASVCGAVYGGPELEAVDFTTALKMGGPTKRSVHCDTDPTTNKRTSCHFESLVYARPSTNAICAVFPVGQFSVDSLRATQTQLVQQNVDLFTFFAASN